MSADKPTLDWLVESWSDGRKVPWERAETDARDDRERGSIRAFRDVTRIASFNRALQRSAQPAAADGPERWGPLLLLEPIGRGVGGEVHRAWDLALHREVALKLLAGGDTPRGHALIDEARALARVRHPNVVTVHGIDEHEGRLGLRMEYLRGSTLEAEIARRGPLPAEDVARMGAQLAHALMAVSEAGLVHRDVKPANIVVESPARAVLADFGLGRRPAVSTADAVPGTGTPMYMSPTRLAGGDASPADDVYGLGATLWHALAGRPPFEVRSLAELRAAAERGPTPALATLRPEAPASLVRAIERAMAPDPARRFASARDLAIAFEEPSALGGSTPRDRRLLIGSLAAVAAVMLAVLLLPRAFHTRPAASPNPAPAAIPPAAAVQAAYDVSATFVRRGGGVDQRLGNGDLVRPGDQLSLEFRATRPVWVYVLNEDEQGESYLLFPSSQYDLGNPLQPDGDVLLPGTIDGKPNAWTVTSRGGREHFLVVASPEPLAELEAEIQRMEAPRADRGVRYAPVRGAVIDRLRGVGGVTEIRGTPESRRAGRIERYRSLAGREQGVTGVWVREITLANPLR